MESFIKFKNYLKNEIKLGEQDVQIMQKDFKEYDRALNELVASKIREGYKESDLRADKEVIVAKTKTAYQGLKVREKIAAINKLKGMVKAFDNDKAIGIVPALTQLYSILAKAFKESILTLDDVSKIFGSEVAFINKKNKTTKFDIIAALGLFYNIDGSFKIAGDSDTFKLLFMYLLEQDPKFIEYDEKRNKKCKADTVIEGIASLYELFLESAKTEVCIEEAKELKVAPVNPLKMAMFAKIYDKKSKKLIAIPDDLEAFRSLMEECNLTDAVKRRVLALINKAKEKAYQPVAVASKLIYLKTKECAPYILEDITNLSNKEKESLFWLLERVNQNGKSLGIYIDTDTDINILIGEYNGIFVAYTWADYTDNTFLVLGAAKSKEKVEKLANERFNTPENMQQLADIYEVMSYPEEKEKLLDVESKTFEGYGARKRTKPLQDK